MGYALSDYIHHRVEMRHFPAGYPHLRDDIARPGRSLFD